jgi:hypothetical protein
LKAISQNRLKSGGFLRKFGLQPLKLALSAAAELPLFLELLLRVGQTQGKRPRLGAVIPLRSEQPAKIVKRLKGRLEK